MNFFNRKKDKEPFVDVWDFSTHTSYRIPARELAPGMVQLSIKGKGTFWADASQLEQSPVRHPPFDEEVRAQIRHIQEAVYEFYPLSLDEWEEGFRRDANPAQEIAIWLYTARIYEEVVVTRPWNDDERQDIFKVLLACMNGPRAHALKTCALEALSLQEAERIADRYYGVE